MRKLLRQIPALGAFTTAPQGDSGTTAQPPTPRSRSLMTDTVILRHCLLPRCTIPALGVLGKVNRQLRGLVKDEFKARAAHLLRTLEHAPIGQAEWKSMPPEALLAWLPDDGKQLSAIRRLNLLIALSREPGSIGRLETGLRKNLLALSVQALKSPGGVVPAVVELVEYVGQRETVLLQLDPATRTAFWECRAQVERERAERGLTSISPVRDQSSQRIAAPVAMAQSSQHQRHGPAFLGRLFRH